MPFSWSRRFIGSLPIFPIPNALGLAHKCGELRFLCHRILPGGAARLGQKEFLHFLGIARGSLSEIDTQLVIATELGSTTDAAELERHINDVFGLLNGLINSLKRSGIS